MAVLLLPARVFARAVTLSFVPMYTSERKFLDLEWDTAWFSRSPSEYNHKLARLCCFLADAAYSTDESGTPTDIAEVFRTLGADPKSISYNYGLDYDSPLGKDQCAYALASIPLPDGSPLIVLAIRGTPAGKNEWLSNLNIADSKDRTGKKKKKEADGEPTQAAGTDDSTAGGIYHEGFLKAERIILSDLLDYTEKRGLDRRRCKLLITGHSRGAAVANIIGSHIVQQRLFDTGGCYIYTVASPNVTTLPEEKTAGPDYSFIWNIVNAEDIVPSIPFNRVAGWNYRKFGNVRVLSSAWSAGRDRFYNEILPTMNRTYRYLTGKDFQPTGTGPFIQIQLARLMASMNPDVDSFYKGAFSLHKPMAKIVPSMFPTEEEKEAQANKKPSLMDRIMGKVDKDSDGTVTKIMEVANNLHQSESYLSFLMELGEKDCFNDTPAVQLVIKGLPEAAVLDSRGNEITKVKEGQTKLFELHRSMSACMLGVQTVALGFPTDEEFEVILTDTSLFPSPVSLTTERYTADGVMISKEEETVWPCRMSVYSIGVGKSQMGGWGLDAKTVTGRAQKSTLKRTGIWSGLKKRLSLEADIDSDLNLGFGLSYGTSLIYGLALYRIPIQKNILGTWEIDAGAGHKAKLWNSTYLNCELLMRGVFVPDSDLRDEFEDETGKSGVFSLVPAARLSLAWQPLRKAQLFASATGSLFIRDFNDAAFESHRVTISPMEMSDDLGLVMSFGVGLRF